MNTREITTLETILKEPVRGYLEQVIEDLKANWKKQSTVKDTEFLTVRATIEKEAKCQALDVFYKELEERYAKRTN